MDQIPEVFMKVAELALKRGHEALDKLDGCWEHDIDDDWRVTLNGRADPTADSKGYEVQPFHMLIEYKGSPVGVISPAGGTMMTGAEDDFVQALSGQLSG